MVISAVGVRYTDIGTGKRPIGTNNGRTGGLHESLPCALALNAPDSVAASDMSSEAPVGMSLPKIRYLLIVALKWPPRAIPGEKVTSVSALPPRHDRSAPAAPALA